MPLSAVLGLIYQELLGVVGFLQQLPHARLILGGATWLFVMYRLFGRGPGERRGYFNWYDWIVIVLGTLLVASLQGTATW